MIPWGFLLLALAPPAPSTIFVFDRPFWLNLHQFLYVLGRAEAAMGDSERRAVAGAPADQARGLERLTTEERECWRSAVRRYAGEFSRQDVIFDSAMVHAGRLLVDADDQPALGGTGLDPGLAAVLESVAPLYRKTWWPVHDSANGRLVARLDSMVARHGPAVLNRIANAYREPWPDAGFPVHISAYANWAGAFSTTAGVLVVSSLDAANDTASMALETLFHEAMHQWDEPIFLALRDRAREQGRRVPQGLSHAMIFYTAGWAVRRELPKHVPYADAEGMWSRGMRPFKEPLEKAWRPYLEGKGTREEAFAELVRRTGRRR